MRWSDLPWTPTPRTLRQFAGLWLLFFLALAVWQGWRHERWAVAGILAVLAVGVGVLGLLRPRAVRPVYVTWLALGFPSGWLMMHLVLGLLFYGLFTPLGLLFRLAGRDVLALRRRPERETYWSARPQPAEVARYFRQF